MNVRTGWQVIAAVLPIVLGSVGSAFGAVDPNGVWLVHVVPSMFASDFTCHATVTQSGSSFDIAMGSDCQYVAGETLTGMWDSGMNQFTASEASTTFCPGGITVGGTVAGDGLSFTGGFGCGSIIGPVSGPVDGTRCGNGVVDPGELCDTGIGGPVCCPVCTAPPAHAGTDCSQGYVFQCVAFECSAQGTCDIVRFSGQSCDDANTCTSDDRCQDGTCTGSPTPAGTRCDLDNELCTEDACDGTGTCTAGGCSPCCGGLDCRAEPLAGCDRPDAPKAQLALINKFPPKRRTVKWKWRPGAIALGDFGAPATSTDYRWCVYQPLPSFYTYPYNLAAEAAIPAGGTCGGHPCWTPRPGTGFKYGDSTKSADGVSKILLNAGANGSILLAGKGTNVQLEWPADYNLLSTDMTVQLRNSDGRCWESQHSDPARVDFVSYIDRHGSPSGAFVD